MAVTLQTPDLTVHVTGAHGVPDRAVGVLLNVTAVFPGGPGFVTAYPCGGAVPAASNVNVTQAGVVAPNSRHRRKRLLPHLHPTDLIADYA